MERRTDYELGPKVFSDGNVDIHVKAAYDGVRIGGVIGQREPQRFYEIQLQS